MAIRIIQLGTPRTLDEGLRIGTVRRPPRGVPKTEYASRNFYDVWLPMLAPSAELMAQGKSVTSDADWLKFAKAYKAEMKLGDTQRVLNMLAAMSVTSHFALGCYCEDESRCHRSLLRDLLKEHGAELI
jgi:uncharacterized protein YeaO (DUF488 family)